ncbi:MAG: sugar phosphate isomerase/epimerase [Planctomycetota bacterium]
MDVACSTLSFTREPLEQALRRIAEMEFSKVDLAVTENGPHLTPDMIINNSATVLHAIRQAPTIGFAALTVRLPFDDEQKYLEQLDGIAHFAKQIAAPVVVVEAAKSGTPFESEVERLTKLERVASLHGSVLTITTKTGTLAELPDTAVQLCQAVPGLGLTLDPTHFVSGPNQGKTYDQVFPFVRHAHLRDSGRRPDQYQVQVGRGEIEYGRIVQALRRFDFRGSLVVAIEDGVPSEMDFEAEVRKLRLLIESLI